MDWIDIESWNRRGQYALFSGMDVPYYNICANVEITEALKFCQRQQFSSFSFMVYLITRTANEIENFRLRIRSEKVCRHEVISPSFTLLNPQEVFVYCTLDYQHDIIAFHRQAQEKIAETRQSHWQDPGTERDDLTFLSCLPWIQFTSASHAMNINPADSIPRFYWGKYFAEGNKTMMPFSVQVHHALVDGVHVGRYMERLQAYLLAPDTLLD